MAFKLKGLQVDTRLISKLKTLARAEKTTETNILNEILATYFKWVRKAEIGERKDLRLIPPDQYQAYQKEMLETQKIIEEYRVKVLKANKERKHKALFAARPRRDKKANQEDTDCTDWTKDVD